MTDTDRALAQIRAALDAGPTPGPWHVDQDRRPGMSWNRHVYHGADLAICFMAHSDGKDPRGDEANARLIAACSPANIAAILAHVEAQKAEIERLQVGIELLDAADADLRTKLDAASDLAEMIASERDEARAERDELRRQLAEAWAEREAMANVLPGYYYMDPPDGGDVSVLEQLRRMAKDAERYRWLQPRFFAADFAYSDPPVCAIVFRWPESAKISANLDREIDAVMGASNE